MASPSKPSYPPWNEPGDRWYRGGEAPRPGPSYPPYFSGPTQKWPMVRGPRRERPALVFWSIVLVVLFVAAMVWLISQLV